MNWAIVGTAGHVDHGKTLLVRALTGEDTDRLPEEKRRGISIDLGFAGFTLPSGIQVGIVDVPGHERFIRNMVAGVTGMDMVLMVVAADEGVMPQTREHLDILELLGVRHGVIVITKVDLVEQEWLELVKEETRAAMIGTFLEAAPMVDVSSTTGQGLDRLKLVMQDVLSHVQRRPVDQGYTRLPVDRVFSAIGFGTVVTGTMLAGLVAEGDRLEILPQRAMVRVRQVQVHGQRVESAQAGQRVALNIVGVGKDEVHRGDVLVEPGLLQPTKTFAARVNVLKSAARPLKNGQRFHLHTGTAEVLARLVILHGEEIPPGGSGLVQVNTEKDITVARGDRYLLRSYSPVTTVGGGAVIVPGRRYRRNHRDGLEELGILEGADNREVVLLGFKGDYPVSVGDIVTYTGLSRQVVERVVLGLVGSGGVVSLPGGEWFVRSCSWELIRRKAVSLLEDFYGKWPLRRGPSREMFRASVWPDSDPRALGAVLERLAEEGVVELKHDAVLLAGRTVQLTPEEEWLCETLQHLFEEAGASPPSIEEALAAVDNLKSSTRSAGQSRMVVEVFNWLVEEGLLVQVSEGLYFHRSFLARAEAMLREHLQRHGTITLSEFRDLLGTTRKFAVPLAEYFDRVQVTQRQGDYRVGFRVVT